MNPETNKLEKLHMEEEAKRHGYRPQEPMFEHQEMELDPPHEQDDWPMRELDEDQQGSLKYKINNLIWVYGPSNLQLGDADILAGKIMQAIMEGKMP